MQRKAHYVALGEINLQLLLSGIAVDRIRSICNNGYSHRRTLTDPVAPDTLRSNVIGAEVSGGFDRFEDKLTVSDDDEPGPRLGRDPTGPGGRPSEGVEDAPGGVFGGRTHGVTL